MVELLKQKWGRMSLSWRWLSFVTIGLVMCAGTSLLVFGADGDTDGLPDAWEMQYFGDLAETANGDSDLDNLTNLQEYQAGTDPTQSDTDKDDWIDSVDSNALSRAYMDFGNLAFTSNDIYQYPGPIWWLGSAKYGGNWQTGAPTAWRVEFSETNPVSLGIDIDRNELTNDLVLRLMMFDHINGSLFLDLSNTNNIVVETNLFGNIMQGWNTNVTVFMNIPLQTYTNAAVINLRRGSGEITLYDALAYIDQDDDGLDSDQEGQAGTSDVLIDSDADEISDYAEIFTHLTDPILADSDGDGILDGAEVCNGTDPLVPNSYSTIPFIELFETNTVTTGDINGQNNWTATPPNTAFVQPYILHDGNQALELNAETGSSTSVQHLFAAAGHDVVWFDMQIRGVATTAPTEQISDAVVLFFNDEGYLVVYDGLQSAGNEWVMLTNRPPVSAEEWVQLTLRLDYGSQKWAVCLNGRLVAMALGFASQRNNLTSLLFEGGEGFADSININTTPSAIMDFDGDGLTNEEEASAGTDIFNPDSDNDGMNDSAEIELGFSPISSNQFLRIDAASGVNTRSIGFEPSEGYTTNALSNQNGWIASNRVTVVDAENHEAGGLQSVALASRGTTNGPTENMLMNIGASAVEQAWITLYVKWSQGQPELGEAPVAGDIYMNHGRLFAYDGTLQNWIASTKTFSVASNAWTRIDFGLDYLNGKYLVCVEGTLAVDAVSFGDTSIITLAQLEIQGSPSDIAQNSYVDDIRISSEEPAEDLDFDDDGLSNAEEYQYGSDPRLVDTDGDTLSDYDEINTHNTDPAKADTDGDGMPDNWEIDNGLDPNDDSDALLDPDGDGLTNLGEYQNGSDIHDDDTDDDGISDAEEVNTYGTDPTNFDTDNDGLPDKWEIDNGTAVLIADATADPDADGLDNMPEFIAGTDPLNADTDDDSVNDGEEVIDFVSNPLVVDFNGIVSNAFVINGAQISDTIGDWAVTGTVVHAVSRRGSVNYVVNVTTGGVYRLEIEGTEHISSEGRGIFKLVMRIDGEYVGKKVLYAAYGTNDTARFVTPYLTNGEHTVNIFWDNVYDGTSPEIKELRFQAMGGPDNDGNGRVDWLDARQLNLCSLDDSTKNYVSPACIEGRGRFLSMMSASGGINVKHGAGARWYADATLSETGTTDIALSFQNGLTVITNAISWDALNILSANASSTLTVRQGDSVKFIAIPEGVTNGIVNIDILGITNYLTNIDTPVIHAFSNAGQYTVVGTHNSDAQVSKSIAINVVNGSFPTNTPACLYGKNRSWSFTTMQGNVVFESDSGVFVMQDGVYTDHISLTLLQTEVDGDHHILARACENGSILDSTPVNGTWVRRGVQGYLNAVETLEDGSVIIEERLITGYFPADAKIKVALSSSGCVFEDDGTILKWLTAEDLTEEGEYTLRIVLPDPLGAFSCHSIRVYEDDNLLGSL